MRVRTQLSRLILVAGLFAVLVAPARAQRVVAPPCEEGGASAHSAFAAPIATADARRLESHAGVRGDGSRAPLSAPDHRSEKRENHRATPSPLIKAQPPTHHRTKNPSRNTPATPGMGQLLRMGSGTETDLTLLEARTPSRHMEVSSDRGPPAGDEPLRLSPAALPRVHHPQAPAPAPEPLLPRSARSSTRHRDVSPACAHATPARCRTFLSALPETPLRGGSCEDRAEGAVSQTRSPSGGVTP